VSDGFGAREGENKGETKGKEKSCTKQENENNKQNEQKFFNDLDATTRPGIEGAFESTVATSEGQLFNEGLAAEKALCSNQGEERRLDHIESAKPSAAAAATTRWSLSTQTPFGSQPKPCSEDADTEAKPKSESTEKDNLAQAEPGSNSVTRDKKHSNEVFKAAEATGSNQEKERRLEHIESADLSGAAAATTGRSFQTSTPFGSQPKPCSEIAEAAENPKDERPTKSDALAETKRMLTEFSLTLSMARAEFFDRAVANVNASFARHTDRYLRTVAGKNAKKKAATALKNFCDELVAKRLAERNAKPHHHHNRRAQHEEWCEDSADEGFEEDDGSSAEPNPDDDDYYTNFDDDFAEDIGDTADPEPTEEWC